MKLWCCDWVPSSVADWLCRELDERGIPGTTYTYTLLSLLHPYFCPHPVPKEPSHFSKYFVDFECISSILHSGHPQELDVFSEEFDDYVHPDADFPELNITQSIKEGSRRAKKRQKKKLQQLSECPEKLWKVAALQCLLTASDEDLNLKYIIDELFLRLKNTKTDTEKDCLVYTESVLDQLAPKFKDSFKYFQSGHTDGTDVFTQNSADFDASDCCSYTSNFPPLTEPIKEAFAEEEKIISENSLNWKSLIKNKFSPKKRSDIAETLAFRQDESLPSNIAAKYVVTATNESNYCKDSNKSDNLEMEVGPNSLVNGALENKAVCFMPEFNDNPVHCVSLSNVELEFNSGNYKENVNEKKFSLIKSDVIDDMNSKEFQEKLEEWECAGDIVSTPESRAVSVDLLGSRLFERSIGSAETTRCNSNTDSSFDSYNNDKMKLIEKTISNSVAQVWGYSPNQWRDHCVENVWDPPSNLQPDHLEGHNSMLQENNSSSVIPIHDNSKMTFKHNPELIFKRDNQELVFEHDKQELAFKHENPELIFKNDNPEMAFSHDNRFECLSPSNFKEGTRIPLEKNWSPNHNWNSLKLIDPKIDPMFSSAFCCSPHSAFKEGARQGCKMSLPEINHENLKNIWSDLNDNDVSSGENRFDVVSEDHSGNLAIINANKNDNIIQKGETEEKLCESFRQLGLEHLWQDSMLLKNSGENSIIGENFNPSPPLNLSCDVTENIEFAKEQDLTSEDIYVLDCAEDKKTDENLALPKIPRGPSGPYIELKHTETSGFSTVIPQNRSTVVVSDEASVQESNTIVTPKGTRTLNSSLDNAPTSQEEENLLTSPRTHFRPIRHDFHLSAIDDIKSENGQTILNSASNMSNSDLVFQRSESGTLYLESELLDGSPKKYMIYREPTTKTTHTLEQNNINKNSVFSRLETISPAPFVPKFKIINNEKFCQTEELESSVNLGEDVDKEFQSNTLRKKRKNYELLNENSELQWEQDYPQSMKLIWDEDCKLPSKEAWELEPAPPTMSFPKWSTQDLNQPSWNSSEPVQLPTHHLPINHGSYNEMEPKICPEYEKDDQDTLSKIKFIWHDSMDKEIQPPIGSAYSHSLSANKYSSTSMKSFSDSWDENPNDVSLHPSREKAAGLFFAKSPWNVQIGLREAENNFRRASLQQDENRALPSRWQLQLEVDQEADEILGGLLPSSPLKASPPYQSPLKNAANRHLDDEEFNFLDYVDGQDQRQPIEDLDHLEPGWDLNEGFEWGPSMEEGDDDDDGGREILVYENEDGQTIMIPVEYLEDSLYDQIFGSATNTPIGGSLPDLPGGQVGDWKKGLSYKLSRRSRGGRFVPPSRRPCSFFLEGNCRRSDCKFSHDLLTITCRFWEEGSCLKGDTCPFRHGFLPSRRRNRSEGDQVSIVEPLSFTSLKDGTQSTEGASKGRPIPKRNRGSAASISSFEIDSETDFPCLGSSVESKIGSLDEQTFPLNVKITKLANAKKKKKFITVTKSLLKEVGSEHEKRFHCKSGRSDRRRAKCSRNTSSFEASSDVYKESTSKKKAKDGVKVKEKDRIDCESLRKILRKRHQIPPQPPFSHEDGTLSDF